MRQEPVGLKMIYLHPCALSFELNMNAMHVVRERPGEDGEGTKDFVF